MSSTSTQWAEVGWYWKRVPGSQLRRQAENRPRRASTVLPVERVEGAVGNPQVWSRTCSTVMASLSLVPNSGMWSATRSSSPSAPSPRRSQTAPATTALPEE